MTSRKGSRKSRKGSRKLSTYNRFVKKHMKGKHNPHAAMKEVARMWRSRKGSRKRSTEYAVAAVAERHHRRRRSTSRKNAKGYAVAEAVTPSAAARPLCEACGMRHNRADENVVPPP